MAFPGASSGSRPGRRQRNSAIGLVLWGLSIGVLPWSWPPVMAGLPSLARLLSGVKVLLSPVLPGLPWVCWGVGLVLILRGGRQLLRAMGGDRPVATSVLPGLQPLQRQGWQFHSNVVMGEQQTVARSPGGKAFCIVIKADRGRIGSDGRAVFRLLDQSRNPFPADFIAQTRQRAARVQQAMCLKQVVPMLVFSDAIVTIDQNPVAGVYVVAAKDLRRSLLELG